MCNVKITKSFHLMYYVLKCNIQNTTLCHPIIMLKTQCMELHGNVAHQWYEASLRKRALFGSITNK